MYLTVSPMSWPSSAPKSLKSTKGESLKVSKYTLGCYPATPSRATEDTGEAWGDSVKQYTSSICFQSCLQCNNCTSLLAQGCRDSLCGLDLRKPSNQALNQIRPLGLKHVSAEMEIELASGGFRL